MKDFRTVPSNMLSVVRNSALSLGNSSTCPPHPMDSSHVSDTAALGPCGVRGCRCRGSKPLASRSCGGSQCPCCSHGAMYHAPPVNDENAAPPPSSQQQQQQQRNTLSHLSSSSCGESSTEMLMSSQEYEKQVALAAEFEKKCRMKCAKGNNIASPATAIEVFRDAFRVCVQGLDALSSARSLAAKADRTSVLSKMKHMMDLCESIKGSIAEAEDRMKRGATSSIVHQPPAAAGVSVSSSRSAALLSTQPTACTACGEITCGVFCHQCGRRR